MITQIDKNTALVLIDLQKGIVQADTAHPIKDVLAQAAQLVTAFRRASLPVVIITVDPTGAAWIKTRKEAPSQPPPPPGFTDIASEIKPEPGDILITKKTWSAFYNTGLHETLQQKNITQIVLGGVSTSIGVEGTARDASVYGYNIAFATDAMTDRLEAAHEHSLKNIFPRLGETGSTAEIIDKLSSGDQ